MILVLSGAKIYFLDLSQKAVSFFVEAT